MKNTFVIKQLENYDINKGYVRTLIREEPHIKELREFVTNIQGNERDLTSLELLSFAGILLGKKNRETSLSSQTFQNLANVFGGFEVLDLLKENKVLSATNLFFLGRDLVDAKSLARLIVSLEKKSHGTDVPKLLDATFAMGSSDSLKLFTFLDTLPNQDRLNVYIKLIDTLFQYPIQIENFLQLLSNIREILFNSGIIDTIISSNPDLITSDNVTRILKLQEPCNFHKLLKVLPINQEYLNILFTFEDSLKKCYWASETLVNFRLAGWDYNPWLKKILTLDRNSYEISYATEKLQGIYINSQYIEIILSLVFDNPAQSIKFAEAVCILNQVVWTQFELDMLCRAIHNPIPLAKAIVKLKTENALCSESITLIGTYPEHALGLALMWVFFAKTNMPVLDALDIILEYPEYAETTTKVLTFLQENELHQEANIRAICVERISHGSLFLILNILKKTNLLHQSNIDLLVSKLSHIKTLASAANCLYHADKLNQANLEQLTSRPLDSLFLAESMGGKPYPSPFTFLTDPGAKNFVSIRKDTGILAQGQRQGFFFAEHTAREDNTFKKATRKTISIAQYEALMKIAGYCGDDSLEADTVKHITSIGFASTPGK